MPGLRARLVELIRFLLSDLRGVALLVAIWAVLFLTLQPLYWLISTYFLSVSK